MNKNKALKMKELLESLTEEQQKEFESLLEETLKEAKEVVEDYTKNPSEISGSVVRIHQDSPFVDERIPDNANWKKVITAPVEQVLEDMQKHNKKVRDKSKDKDNS